MTESDGSFIGCFAEMCENMNDYARSIRGHDRDVRTSSDIRNYKSGWKLEKYIEIEVNKTLGHWAVLAVELSFKQERWSVSASLSISHDDYFEELTERMTESSNDLRDHMGEVLADLKGNYEGDTDFRKRIDFLAAD